MGHPLSSPEHARHALLYMWRIRKFEEAVEDLVETLMGRKPELRFRFIQENAEFAVDDLDV